MDDDPFASDPFMDLLAGATGKLYPSQGTLQWGDRLARQYGQQRTEAAIMRVMKDPRVQKHEVLSAAEQLLQFAAAKDGLAQDRAKEAELEQARKDRAKRELDYIAGAEQRASTDPRPLSELIPAPWRKTGDSE